MRVRIEFEIDCPAEAAWEALHSPRVASQLYHPLIRMSAVDSFPERFNSGDRVRVALRLFGRIPMGSQLIAIEDLPATRFGADARTMRDAGRPLSGPLALLSHWDHRVTTRTASPQHTVWHDELTIHGVFAPVFWPVLAGMWRWRRHKLTRLARTWGC